MKEREKKKEGEKEGEKREKVEIFRSIRDLKADSDPTNPRQVIKLAK